MALGWYPNNRHYEPDLSAFRQRGVSGFDPVVRDAKGQPLVYLNSLTSLEVLPNLLKKGVVFAGGLHKEIATKYIRCGHMGVSVTDPNRKDLTKAIESLKEALTEVGHKV